MLREGTAHTVATIPDNCFEFTPESAFRGEAKKSGSTKWPITLLMLQNEAGANIEVPDKFEEELKMWLKENTFKGKGAETKISLPKNTARKPYLPKDGFLHWYTDGSAKEGKAGYGVYKANTNEKIYGRPTGDQTNDRGELSAILEGLQTCPITQNLALHVDAQIALDRISKWLNPLTSGDIENEANSDLLREIQEILKTRAAVAITEFHKEKSHRRSFWEYPGG